MRESYKRRLIGHFKISDQWTPDIRKEERFSAVNFIFGILPHDGFFTLEGKRSDISSLKDLRFVFASLRSRRTRSSCLKEAFDGVRSSMVTSTFLEDCSEKESEGSETSKSVSGIKKGFSGAHRIPVFFGTGTFLYILSFSGRTVFQQMLPELCTIGAEINSSSTNSITFSLTLARTVSEAL